MFLRLSGVFVVSLCVFVLFRVSWWYLVRPRQRWEAKIRQNFASTRSPTHNHQVMSPTPSPLSHPGGGWNYIITNIPVEDYWHLQASLQSSKVFQFQMWTKNLQSLSNARQKMILSATDGNTRLVWQCRYNPQCEQYLLIYLSLRNLFNHEPNAYSTLASLSLLFWIFQPDEGGNRPPLDTTPSTCFVANRMGKNGSSVKKEDIMTPSYNNGVFPQFQGINERDAYVSPLGTLTAMVSSQVCGISTYNMWNLIKFCSALGYFRPI